MSSFDRKEWLKYIPEKDNRIDGYVFDESGILNVNKPSGISSMDVLRVIKRNGQVRKAGHGGTLDPLASGVLPILLNKATRISGDYLGSEKSYDGILNLGCEYDTQDITGKPVGEPKEVTREISLEEMNEVAARFMGTIEQLPPMYSALKKGGRPLYDYARKGQDVLREARTVTVMEFQITERISKSSFAFYVNCQKGVYVRTLVHDLGNVLGYGGAIASLRRLSVGPSLTLDNSVDLELIQSPDDIRKHLIAPPD
ncbi:MAG: tRNA pseudouridine(55) synthase TruB [Leptospirales bacterium]